MTLDQMIFALKEWIEFQTAEDIIDCPDQRKPFQPYVKMCVKFVPKRAVPFVVLYLLELEAKKPINQAKRFLKRIFKSDQDSKFLKPIK